MPVIPTLCTLLLIGLPVGWYWKSVAKNTELKALFWPALLLKIGCGLLIGVFYKGIDDTFEFQYAANRMTAFVDQDLEGYFRVLFFNDLAGFTGIKHISFNPGTNSFFVSKLLSLLNFITGGNYYLNSLFFSVYSFFGCWTFVRICALIFPGSRFAAGFAFLFFPSVVFWSSGIMKESILLGSLGFFWAAVLQLHAIPGADKIKQIVIVLVAGWLLWKIRFFLAAVVFAFTASWLVLSRRASGSGASGKFKFTLLLFPALIIGGVLYLIQASGVFDLNYVFKHIVWDYRDLLKLSLTKPHIEYSELTPDFLGILRNTPEAVLSSFFRPFLGESLKPFYMAAGLENAFLLILTIGCSYSLYKYRISRTHQFYVLLLIYILVISTVLALPTPNLGTLNRYRVAFLPFAVFLMLQTAFWQNQIRKLFPENK